MPGTNDTPYTVAVVFKIGGRPLTNSEKMLLEEGWVDSSVNVPGAFQLSFSDMYSGILKKINAKVGAKVEIHVYADGKGGSEPLLTGEITALEAIYDGSGTHYIVRGLDYGHRLLRGTRVERFEHLTASRIAQTVATKCGLEIGEIDPTTVKHELITQSNVSDWVFLNKLAEENDREVTFTDDGKFQFVKPKKASGAPSPKTESERNPRVIEQNKDLHRLQVSVTASDQVQEVEVRGWDVNQKRSLSKVERNPNSDELQIGTTPKKLVSKFSKARLLNAGIPYETKAEVDNAAKSLAADVTDAFAELDAEVTGHPSLRPGVPISVNGFGEPFEGRYTITAVRHRFSPTVGYRTDLTVSGRQHRSLFGLTSGGGSGGNNIDGPHQTHIPGVVIATVQDIRDPKRRGRVKLQFPWLDDKYISDWARVMQFGGVKGGGNILPDVKDEVLVAFDRGDFDHPYVIGGLYNGRDRAPNRVPTPISSTGKIQRRDFEDRDQNRVELLDSIGTKGVKVATKNDRLKVFLNKTQQVIEIDAKTGRVSIHGSSAVDISTTGLLSMKSGSMSITTGDLNIKAGATQLAVADLNISAAATQLEASSLTGLVAETTFTGNFNVVGLLTQDMMPVMVIPA